MKRLDYKIAIMTISCACSAAAAQSIEWAIADDGLWGDPVSWVLGNVPDATSEHALLGLSGSYSAISSANYTYGSLTISNPLAELWIQSGTNATQSGLENHGLVRVGGAGASGSPTLRFTSTALISGAGEIILDAQTQPSDAQLLGSFPPITHADGHTIRGAGYIFGVLNNDGDIYADDPNGVGLEISGLLTQGPTGRLGARQGALRILPSTTFQGGELYTEGDGVIELPAANISLKNTLLDGHINYPGGSGTLKIESTLTNNGSIVVNADENELGAKLELASSYTIDGDGEIVLKAGLDRFSTEVVIHEAQAFTIGKDQVIRGSGVINSRIDQFPQRRATLINHGMVIADDPDQPLYIGGQIYGPGVYLADNASLVFRAQSDLEDLVLDSSGTGTIEFEPFDFTLRDVVNLTTVYGAGLHIRGSFRNEGLVDLGPQSLDPGFAVLTFPGDSSIEGSGTIRLETTADQSYTSQIDLENGSTVTLGPDQTIEGSGLIWMRSNTSKLINRGVIRANNPEVPLRLQGSYVGENGQFIADNAVVVFWGGTNQNRSDNLVLSSIGDGHFEIDYMVCNTIENQSDLIVLEENDNDFYINETLINNGSITVLEDGAIILVEDSSIQGVGTIQIQGGYVGSNSSGTLNRIGNGQTVTGFGALGAIQLQNDGRVIADVSGEGMSHGGTHIAGSGIYEADSGHFRLAGRFKGITIDSINNGYVLATNNDAPIIDTLICNSALRIEPNATISIEDTLEVNGETSLRNSSQFDQATLRFTQDGQFSGIGDIVLDPHSALSGTRIIAEQGTHGTIVSEKSVIGSGQLLGSIQVQGELNPGLPFRRFEVDSLTLGPESTTRFQVDGLLAAQFDQITVINDGSLNPGGTIIVELRDGYTPSLTNTWNLISTDGDQLNLNGWYDDVILPAAPTGFAFRLHHGSDAVRLVYTVKADFDGNLALDIFDVFMFLDAFESKNPDADMNSDGVIDVFDVFVLLNSFGV
jgi:hypothetical protein